MIPVHINSTNEHVGFEIFVQNLLQICAEHHKQGRASAFAFIIYDFDDPHLRKVLMDSEYWQALNKLSGQYLTIFSLFEGSTRHEFNKTLIPKRVRLRFDAVRVNTKRDLTLSYREIIESFFGGSDFTSPCILCFQVDEEQITDHFFIELKENKIEEGFNELKSIIDEAVKSVKRISQENKSNYKEIFDNIEGDLTSAVWWKKTKKKVKTPVGVVSFVSIFTG